MTFKLFGEIALEEGYIPPEVLAATLLQQEILKTQGLQKFLGQILLEQEKLTNRQIMQILQRQKKVILMCSQCETPFNIFNKEPGKIYTCLICGSSLQFPRTALSTLVVGEIQGELVRKSEKSKSEGLQNLGVSVLAENEKAGHDVDGIEKTAKYNIQRELARGGMGVIYVATDNDLKREIALKFLKEGSSQTEKERFIQEFQITAGIQHPNIVPVYEVGKSGGEIYYSMKWIQGKTLKQILEGLLDKAISSAEGYGKGKLLRIFCSACHGVAFAHSKRVIHRNLKPDHIMVSDFGEVVVLGWRPPEQRSGAPEILDLQSDIFSLGVILYEILTLKQPSSQTEFSSILQEPIQAHFIPPQKVNRRVPKALSDICIKALSRSQEDRFSCVQEMIEDVEGILEKRTAFLK